MPRKFVCVKDIDDSKETWRLVGRVIDVWTLINNKSIEYLEMIVMNAKLVIK